MDGRTADTLYRFEAGGAAERVVVGVEDALERNRGRGIRRHCSAFFGTPDARADPGTKLLAVPGRLASPVRQLLSLAIVQPYSSLIYSSK